MRSRHSFHALTVAAGICLGFAWPSQALAQYDYDPLEGRPLLIYAQGGAYSPLVHLDPQRDVDFKMGFTVGGGVGYQVNRHLAIRGSFNFSRAGLRDESFNSTITGTKFNRYLYDCEVQLRYPVRVGVAPYLVVGAGGLTVQRDSVRTRSSFTKAAVKIGLGLSYQIAESPASVHLQTTGWIYQWDRYGFDNTQVDVAISAGLSYRFKL